MPADSDYDILKTKLNAISESAESDVSKDSFPRGKQKATETEKGNVILDFIAR